MEPFHVRPSFKIKYIREKKRLQDGMSSCLATNFKRLYDTGDHADITLTSTDRKTSKDAHKILVHSRCPELLASTGSHVTPCTADVLQTILRQIYSEGPVNKDLLSGDLKINDPVGDHNVSFEEMERLCQREEVDELVAAFNSHKETGPALLTSVEPVTDGDVYTDTQLDGDLQLAGDLQLTEQPLQIPPILTYADLGDGTSDFDFSMDSSACQSDLEACCPLGQDLLDAFTASTDTDLVLRVGAQDFKVHRTVLMARCPYFEAMLGGPWSESRSDTITLEKQSALVVHQSLLYMYGGVVDLMEGCSAFDVAKLADMLNLDGLKDVAAFHIQKNYCHFFHKPICRDCMGGVCEILPLLGPYGLADLRERCVAWACRHFVRVWPTQGFLLLPPDLLHEIGQLKITELNKGSASIDVLESASYCKNILSTMSGAAWADSAREMVGRVYDSCIRYYSDHFATVVRKIWDLILKGKISSWSLLQWEEILLLAAEQFSGEQAVDAYQTLISVSEQKADGPTISSIAAETLREYKCVVDTLLEKCEQFIAANLGKIHRTQHWSKLDPVIQKKLTERAVFVVLPGNSDRFRQRSRSPLGLVKPKKLTVREIMSGVRERGGSPILRPPSLNGTSVKNVKRRPQVNGYEKYGAERVSTVSEPNGGDCMELSEPSLAGVADPRAANTEPASEHIEHPSAGGREGTLNGTDRARGSVRAQISAGLEPVIFGYEAESPPAFLITSIPYLDLVYTEH